MPVRMGKIQPCEKLIDDSLLLKVAYALVLKEEVKIAFSCRILIVPVAVFDLISVSVPVSPAPTFAVERVTFASMFRSCPAGRFTISRAYTVFRARSAGME